MFQWLYNYLHQWYNNNYKKTFYYLYYIRLYKILRSMHNVVEVTRTVLCHTHLVMCQTWNWIAVSGRQTSGNSPFSLFRASSSLCMWQDSILHRGCVKGCQSITVVLSQSILLLVEITCSAKALLFISNVWTALWCSFTHCARVLPVCPMYGMPDVYLTLQSSHKFDTQPNACDTEQCEWALQHHACSLVSCTV